MQNNIKNFPEEITKDGVKIYGETSYANQMAVLSHYLHNHKDVSKGGYREAMIQRNEIIDSIRGYLSYKGVLDDYTENDIVRVADDPFQTDLFAEFIDVPFPAPENPKFTFIDLFAGIGGFRMAMQSLGGKCVFSSEWNKFAQKTYMANFGEMPFGDITKEGTKQFIPRDFDILCAGFPCQPFSIAGVAKKNSLGRPTGFEDKTQGTLFFDVADILKKHRPKAFFLENVKNLLSHDKGNTFKVIKETLEELNYSIYFQVMDGKAFVPQHRERIMLVGFDKRKFHGKESFSFPQLEYPPLRIKDILQEKVDSKYTLSDKLWTYLQNYAIAQRAKGNGFGFGLVDLDGISRTLSARYYKDGSEILIPQGKNKNPRKLTPRECARLMGYPDQYVIDMVSDVQAYKQCGNSVIVPLIGAVSKQIIETLKLN
ncbi:DNA (cytosine-5-)-methyltransferase [Hallella bergensis]|uniref:DNA (cytosine-5-)-methyltransferase n=1 Tax=Hallella bergensis TaxID=242750 RepID=UPI0023F587FB|nr:DNA (cytosine-5-)-methyltransferase [Hallella bergensis]